MRVVNAYTIAPNKIEPGDVMMWVVKAEVQYRDSSGKLRYRIYRCPYEHEEGDPIPQGYHVANMEEVCEAFFSSLHYVGEPG